MTQKMTGSLRIAALALAAVGVQQSAQAFTYNANDVFLVVQNSTTKMDMLVDIGPISNFNKKDGVAFNINTYNSTDFASVGSAANVNWGVFSYASSGSVLYSTAAANPGAVLTSAQTSAKVTMGGIADGGVTPTGPVAYNTSSLVTQTNANSSAFTAIVATGGGSSFNMGTSRDIMQGAGGNSTAELYQFPTGVNASQRTPVDLGTFSMNNSGALSFQAVPEPGTYALLGMGALGMYFFRRIRK